MTIRYGHPSADSLMTLPLSTASAEVASSTCRVGANQTLV